MVHPPARLGMRRLLLLLWMVGADAFLPSARCPSPRTSKARDDCFVCFKPSMPASGRHPSSRSDAITSRGRAVPSATSTRLRSFFGLGPAELVLIAVAGLIVVGPSKILEFSRDAGEVAGKSASGLGDEWSGLKAIPEEFQKGVEEGETEWKSRRAKVMDDVDDKE